jgi:hypothetical protein
VGRSDGGPLYSCGVSVRDARLTLGCPTLVQAKQRVSAIEARPAMRINPV